MADLKAFLAKQKETRAAMATKYPQGFCLVTSLATRRTLAGTIHEVSTDNAGSLLTEGTHRLATDAEIAAYHQKQNSERVRLATSQMEAARAHFQQQSEHTKKEPHATDD